MSMNVSEDLCISQGVACLLAEVSFPATLLHNIKLTYVNVMSVRCVSVMCLNAKCAVELKAR